MKPTMIISQYGFIINCRLFFVENVILNQVLYYYYKFKCRITEGKVIDHD